MLQKLPGNTIPATRRQLRNACFTINNPTMTRDAFIERIKYSERATYVVVGYEVGESGTPHFQGYIEFNRPMDFGIVQELLLNGHIEARRGTPHQASFYCQKDEMFTEWGVMSNQGKRTDIADVVEMISEGASTSDIAVQYPEQYIKYFKGIIALQTALIRPRVDVPEVRVFYGSTGTGKSYRARQWLPNAYVWHPQQGTWFDGYKGEQEVIFEEFRAQIPFGMLLSLLDRYCCKVQYKGGVVEFAALKIAITSPVAPVHWYQCLDQNDRFDQLSRRLSDVMEL